MGYIQLTPDRLREICVELLVKSDVSHDNAVIIANILVDGDLRGVESHGVRKLPTYIERIRKGELNPKPEMRVTRENDNTAVIDGDRCPGGLAAYKAMQMAIKKAETHAIGAVAVRNVGRCGALAYFTSMALEHNMIGFMTAQGATKVPPYGGKSRLLNTSPWSFAFPAENRAPIVLDMAATIASNGKIAIAEYKKEKIPSTWILNKDGQPTDDPADAATGFQQWIGGYKGFGLAVVDQLLAGILGSGSFLGAEQPNTDVFNRGHFILAMNIESFIPADVYKKLVDDYIDKLKASELIDGVAEILLPGERSYRAKQSSILNNCVSVIDTTWSKFEKIAGERGVSLENLM